VGLYGFLGDHQPRCDLGVGEALGEEPQYLRLAGGQFGELGDARRGGSGALAGEFADQAAGYVGCEERVRAWGAGSFRRLGVLRDRGLDEEAASGCRAGPQPAADRRRPLPHPGHAVTARRCHRRWSGAVVADPQLKRMVGVAELDVDRRAGRVAARVGESLLNDAIRRQFCGRVEPKRCAADEGTSE